MPESKRVFLFLIFQLFFFKLFAQQTEIKGKIKDASSGDNLEFANVALLSLEDSTLIGGTTADFEGNFSFMANEGNYLLRVGFIGYDNFYKKIVIKGKQLNIGIVRLQSGTKALDEVTVVGVTSIFTSDIDKRVYNVENNILAEGASASELLNTLPSVQIDENGGITMRGSGNILIYINGRPTNMTSEETENILAQFPANSIKDVELITNPSARYDAQGVGGIINIILKKDVRLGLNGQVNAAVGTRDKYQTGLSLNYGLEKWIFNASYNFQSRYIFELSESLRRSFAGNISPFLDQDFDTRNTNQNHLVNVGIDHLINENATWGVYGRFSHTSRDRVRIYNQRHQNINRGQDSLFVRVLTEDQFARNLEVGTTFDVDIDTLGQKLYSSISYAATKQDRIEFFDQRFFDANNLEDPGRLQDQIYGRPIDSDLWIAQVDYTKPYANGGRLESGLKGTFSYFRPSQFFEQLDLESNEYVNNDTITNAFDFDELVLGGYVIYRNTMQKLAYQLGLRAEQTYTLGIDDNSGISYENNYFSLFPSIYLTYDLGEEEEFLINFSRRINRPSWGQLAPFYNAQDLLNTRLGNPVLRPEFTDSYEMGYTKGWEKWLMSSTLYHRRTRDAMTRVFSLLENNGVVQLQKNANYRHDSGLEMINQFQFTSNLDLTLTGNFFYTEIDGRNIRENFLNSNFTWSVNLIGNWVLPEIVTLQFMADYRGPVVMPQGEVDPIWGINIGAKRDILKNRGTISVNVTDIFNTRIYNVRTSDIEFSQVRMFNMETRIGTLSFTYRFGGFKSREERLSPTRYSDDPF